MTAKILIIDDENLFREDLATLLGEEGYICKTAVDGEQGMAVAQEFGPDVVLCDIAMPGQDGIELLPEILRICPESFVMMITAYGTLETALEAFRRGASDYIMKPLILDDMLQKIKRLLEHKRLVGEVRSLRRQLFRKVGGPLLIGQSEAIQQVKELTRKVSTTRSTVLITGASGTGKELVARTIHAISAAAPEPFVAINAAGIPDHLLESELFGHTKGAFTGADRDRQGFFELAGKGTILLDEIGEMPLSLQSKLLRAVEQRTFIPVGGQRPVALEARLMASTNKRLEDLVQAGRFREDLYFRLAVFEIQLPQLKEHREDIPALCEDLIGKLNQEMNRHCLGVDNEAIRVLMSHDWPGNVRELRNVLERAMILTTEQYISVAELPVKITGSVPLPTVGDDLRAVLAACEKEHIRKVLRAAGGNKGECAERLGVNPSTLYRKMTDFGLTDHAEP